MMEANIIIDRLRRDLALSAVLRFGLLATALFCLALPLLGVASSGGSSWPLFAVFLVWMALFYRSARGSRLAAIAPQLIAAGELAEAEQSIHGALRSFSLFSSVKLRSLHSLAALRHAQKRFGEAAMLCRELLRHRLGTLAPAARSARLILADSLLEAGDIAGAHQPIAALYSERLSLHEAVDLTSVQLKYLAGIGQWDLMLQELRAKLDLIELMAPPSCFKSHALLAMAAEKAGKTDLLQWLLLRLKALGE
jgi:hypothetical protein